MKNKELQDQINKFISNDKKVPVEIILDNFLKNEGFIHKKELNFALKNREKSDQVYNTLKTKLPEITIEICPHCENIINYYKKIKNDYYKCPRCNQNLLDPIETRILINFPYLSDNNKLILIEDLKTKIKSFHLKESLFDLLNISPEKITEFLNKNY